MTPGPSARLPGSEQTGEAEAAAGRVVVAAERLEFETLISDTSAELIAAQPAAVGETIERALERVRVFFGADRCILVSVSPEQHIARATHAAYADGISRVDRELDLVALFPWSSRKLLNERAPVIVHRLVDLPPESAVDRASLERWMPIRSNLAVPICAGDVVSHVMIVHWVNEECLFPDAHVPRLRVLSEMIVNALHRQRVVEELQAALTEVRQLHARLETENLYLRQEVEQSTTRSVLGRSPAIRRARLLAEQVAQTNATVLLIGETGTGKERFASAIHEASPRRSRAMVRINCSAIPVALMESELFGREKGAYTGALSQQIGRFEVANESTLFLDEVADLPLDVQVKLLRVLQERTIERLGSPRPIHVDVRIIAATNRDLEHAVHEGRFRDDLFYRLNVFPIHVPPLRDRRDDIPQLVAALIDEIGTEMGKRFDSVSKAGMDTLQRAAWPGNVRELRNVVERAMILESGPTLHLEGALLHTAAPGLRLTDATERLDDIERTHILRVLDETGWRIKGPRSASVRLGMKPSTLYFRMKKLQIDRPGTAGRPRTGRHMVP